MLRDGSAGVDEGLLVAMRDMMTHRGPDDSGMLAAPGGGIAMRRLSIIDLATGKQPILNEDGTVAVICNGEIYNYLELRKELAARGHVFRTRTDVEAIVHLYEEMGERCVERLRGMFAFAVWDKKRRILLTARDRLGIKPLYYAETGDAFLFSSELKSLLLHPGVDRSLDPDGLSEYLTFQHTLPPRTLVRGIRKLAAGHLIVVKEGRASERRYWDLEFPDRDGKGVDEEGAVEEFAGVFEETVRGHLMSEVPLGVFLSGGLDSSAVTASVAGMTADPVRTFSVGYAEGDIYGELEYADMVAAHAGTAHRELRIGEDDYAAVLDEFAWFSDEPVADEASIPLMLLSKMVKEDDVTVMLSGEGADEVLGGYSLGLFQKRFDRIRTFQRLLRPVRGLLSESALRLLPGRVARKLASGARPVGSINIDEIPTMIKTFTDEGKAAVCPPVREAAVDCDEELRETYRASGTEDPLHQIMYVYSKIWLPENVLVKADKMTMATSVELRVPFLDHVLVETAARIPSSLKVKREANGEYVIKNLLKRIMEGRLPREVIHRPKQGFPVPIGEWFEKGLKRTIRESLLGEEAAGSGWYDRAEIERLMEEHRNSPSEAATFKLKNLLILEKWRRSVLETVKPREESR